jgi:hypothetical protein
VGQFAFERACRLLGTEIEQHLRSLDEECRVACEHGFVGDVACQHGLAEALRGDHHQVLALLDEVSTERPVEHASLDLRRPVPIELIDGLEAPELGATLAPFERTSFSLGDLLPGQFFEQHTG